MASEVKRLEMTRSDSIRSLGDSESESDYDDEPVGSETGENIDQWHVFNLVKTIKEGTPEECAKALNEILELDLCSSECQAALLKFDALGRIVGLLTTKFPECRIAALKILKEISKRAQIRKKITEYGGVHVLLKMLNSSSTEICLAAQIISSLGKYRKARRSVRHHGGIVKLLDILRTTTSSNRGRVDVDVLCSAALALRTMSCSRKSKEAIRQEGGVSLLVQLLQSEHEGLLAPVVGTLEECISKDVLDFGFSIEGLIKKIGKFMESGSKELQMSCASMIFKVAEDKKVRDLVRKYGELKLLVDLIGNSDNINLMAAATGAIWKCSVSEENIIELQEYDTLSKLMDLMVGQPEDVLINVVGAISEFAKYPAHQAAIRSSGSIPRLMAMLKMTRPNMVINVTRALSALAGEPESMKIMQSHDVLIQLWSLLRLGTPEVQSSSAWAICSLIDYSSDTKVYDEIHFFNPGMNTLIKLLSSPFKDVVSGVCGIISRLAKDQPSLLMLTELGVIRALARLLDTTDNKLRHHLAEAVANCCTAAKNQAFFRKFNGFAPLIKFLKSEDPMVHMYTAKALFQLSADRDNCVIMHKMRAVELLIDMMKASDEELQESSAKCASRIRRVIMSIIISRGVTRKPHKNKYSCTMAWEE